MKLMEKMKKDKKGFTLIEMIVVIVIIGILLAILIPGMFRYIDKAKDKQIMLNARTAYLNLATATAEMYGQEGVSAAMVKEAVEGGNKFGNTPVGNRKLELKYQNKTYATIEKLPNDEGTISEVTFDIDTRQITAMKYTESGKVAEMKESKWLEIK